MSTRMIKATLLLTLVAMLTISCASSRKHGTHNKSRFKGAIPCPCENQH